jgi:GTP pyrophosphokinase
VIKGKEQIEKEIRAQEFDLKEVLTTENIKRVCEKYAFTGEEDLYAAVGFNGITAQQVVNRLAEKMRKKRDQEEALEKITTEMKAPVVRKSTESGVIVKGIDNLLIRLSRCCSPVPGDKIVGFITKGRGVSVHRADCPNVQNDETHSRIIEVEWEQTDTSMKKDYQVDIEISAFDRAGLLNEVLQVVNESKTHIAAVSGKSENDIATIHMTIKITNIAHLHKVADRIKHLPDVYSVQRIIN